MKTLVINDQYPKMKADEAHSIGTAVLNAQNSRDRKNYTYFLENYMFYKKF